MKSVSNNFLLHIQGEVHTLATCWLIIRADGVSSGYTSNTCDLFIDGVNYEAATGFTPTQFSGASDLSVDNMEITALLDSSSISEVSIAAGLYDYAQVFMFLVNYQDLQMGILKLSSGRLGEVSTHKNFFVAEIRSLSQNLQQTVGEVYSNTCRADFCDLRCGLTIADYTYTGSLTSAIDSARFADSGRIESAGFYDYGYFTFTSGANSGLSMEIKQFSSGEFTVFLPFPFSVLGNETYSVYHGCNKLLATCKTFSNVINFRGEPYIPGQDEIMRFGGQ